MLKTLGKEEEDEHGARKQVAFDPSSQARNPASFPCSTCFVRLAELRVRQSLPWHSEQPVCYLCYSAISRSDHMALSNVPVPALE